MVKGLATAAAVAAALAMFAGTGLSGALAQEDDVVVVGPAETSVAGAELPGGVSAEELAEAIIADVLQRVGLPAGSNVAGADVPTGGAEIVEVAPTGGEGEMTIDVPAAGDINVGGSSGGEIVVGGDTGGGVGTMPAAPAPEAPAPEAPAPAAPAPEAPAPAAPTSGVDTGY